MAEQTKTYRMRSGVGKHYVDGKLVGPGDTVRLTAAQVEAFGDKFELSDSDKKKILGETSDASDEEVGGPGHPAARPDGLPQDHSASTPALSLGTGVAGNIISGRIGTTTLKPEGQLAEEDEDDGEGEEGDEGDDTGSEEVDSIVNANINEAKAAVEEIDDPALLDAIKKAERKARDRSTLIAVIDARKKELREQE